MKEELKKKLNSFIKDTYPAVGKELRLAVAMLVLEIADAPENAGKMAKLDDGMILIALTKTARHYCENNLFMTQLENSILKARLEKVNNNLRLFGYSNRYQEPDLNIKTPDSEPHTPDSKSRSQTPSPPKNLLGTAI